jgi:hypothetical protein
MSFSAVLLVVFAAVTWGNIQDIRDAESAVATMLEDPILSPAGGGQIATVRVGCATEDGRSEEAYVIGVPIDSTRGDTVTIHYLGSNPQDATVDDPPNRTLGLVLSVIFALIGVGGIWGFGNEYPFGPEEESPVRGPRWG